MNDQLQIDLQTLIVLCFTGPLVCRSRLHASWWCCTPLYDSVIDSITTVRGIRRETASIVMCSDFRLNLSRARVDLRIMHAFRKSPNRSALALCKSISIRHIRAPMRQAD